MVTCNLISISNFNISTANSALKDDHGYYYYLYYYGGGGGCAGGGVPLGAVPVLS